MTAAAPPPADDPEYRVEFTVQRRASHAEDFVDVGFGSSGAWDDVGQCAHIVASAVQTGEWETEPGMPDPDEIVHPDRENRDV